ncbi:hypothetical protein NBRC116599_03360 [Aquicoccus sp. SU-CL01552]
MPIAASRSSTFATASEVACMASRASFASWVTPSVMVAMSGAASIRPSPATVIRRSTGSAQAVPDSSEQNRTAVRIR